MYKDPNQTSKCKSYNLDKESYNLDENYIDNNGDGNENDNCDEVNDYIEDEEDNAAESLLITFYFTLCEVSTKKGSKSNAGIKKKNQRWSIESSTSNTNFTSTTNPMPTTNIMPTTNLTLTMQLTIKTIIQKQLDNATSLPEKKQNCIIYRLTA
ncbi:13440_t:CDS:2 [Cetraspora pellucida]|uniref:13440_t:CDS:1 n=1 Tax=Cetraspora pellucida TaxID=1433469 RepID=A0ACA9LFA8_9GLOM|nr:13440_t:CDS:2 [Cetraspora pellucida]